MRLAGKVAIFVGSLLAAVPGMASESSSPTAPIPFDDARAVFDRAQVLCTRDHGRLWGVSLCGPVMLVEPKTRRIVASQADAEGRLEAHDGVFAGILPADQNASNTAFEWSGVRWTQLLWPLPPETMIDHDVLLAHELFHRVQPQLRIDLAAAAGDNSHLDTPDGRYFLQLEWRALARALQASDDEAERRAIADALAFRAARYRRFPGAESAETGLELIEGLAEYTGVMVGKDSAAAREAAAVHDLESHADDRSFVRSFALATGPAYGLLLDAVASGWRLRLTNDSNLAWLLRDAVGIEVKTGDAAVAAVAGRYDGPALRVAEAARERERQAQLQRYRRLFLEGPVLVLELSHMKVKFDPRSLQPLDEAGTVYPTLRISDDWGVLEATGGAGALLRKDWSAVVIAAPASVGQSPLHGDGWTLTLAPGWKLVPGARDGDWKLQAPQR